MNLTFSVNKQIIQRTDCEIPVAKSENYLFAEFSFSDEWQGTKTAIFNNGTAYSVILEDNRCLVPWEVITANGFSVSVFCGNRITANTAYVMVIPSGYVEGETPAPPSPTVYDQLMEEVNKKQDKLVSGENIKKINNESLLGSGNIDIQGGGGTSDYTKLSNKPKINGAELNGNKTSEQLGLQIKLVSGTNIKTINNLSLLGSGNIKVLGLMPPQAYQYTTAVGLIEETSIQDGWYILGQSIHFRDAGSSTFHAGDMLGIFRNAHGGVIAYIGGNIFVYDGTVDISYYLEDIDLEDYYTKDETDTLLGGKQDTDVELSTGAQTTQTQTVKEWLQDFYDEVTGATAVVSQIEGVIG